MDSWESYALAALAARHAAAMIVAMAERNMRNP
jgi:hypothetical protein